MNYIANSVLMSLLRSTESLRAIVTFSHVVLRLRASRTLAAVRRDGPVQSLPSKVFSFKLRNQWISLCKRAQCMTCRRSAWYGFVPAPTPECTSGVAEEQVLVCNSLSTFKISSKVWAQYQRYILLNFCTCVFLKATLTLLFTRRNEQ